MITAKIKSLAFKDLNVQVPESADEFNKLAGDSDACRKEAVNNILYRSTLAEFRAEFLEFLAESTGIERNYEVTKPEVRDANGAVTQEERTRWTETEQTYFDRVMAALVQSGKHPSVEAAVASFYADAQRILDGVKFDPSATERASAGPKKTPKYVVEIVDAILGSSGGDLPTAIGKFNRKNILGLTLDTGVDRKALEAAVWEDRKARDKQTANEYSAS